MSRIGKKPIVVPEGVTVTVSLGTISVKGPLGQDVMTMIDGIEIEQQNSVITIINKRPETDKKAGAMMGLSRSLISNLVVGVSHGFEKELEIVGVGYRATQQNKDVQLQLGYSHPVIYSPPEGIAVEVMEATKLKVKGINKQKVGQVAANIRELRPPEPYKGKGIRYKNEHVRKKAGKTGK